MFGRSKVAMVVAEFFGTATLSLAVFSMIGRNGFEFFVAAVAAIVMGVLVLVFANASGAYFNPAVTFGMWVIKKIRTLDAIVYIAAQMLGGLGAWRLAVYFINSNLKNNAAGAFSLRVAVAEAVGTLIFTFGIAAATYQSMEGGRRAATVGTSLFAGILVASLAANGILNPAVALGVQSWSRSYIFAPFAGALVGAGLYSLLFVARAPRVKAAKVVAKPVAKTKAVAAPKKRTTTAKRAKKTKR